MFWSSGSTTMYGIPAVSRTKRAAEAEYSISGILQEFWGVENLDLYAPFLFARRSGNEANPARAVGRRLPLSGEDNQG